MRSILKNRRRNFNYYPTLKINTTIYPVSEIKQKKPLFLVIERVYFDQILSGKKLEEYRDNSQFYKSRFCNYDKKTGEIESYKNYDQLILQEGYHTNARRITIEVKKIELEEIYTISLGDILEKNF